VAESSLGTPVFPMDAGDEAGAISAVVDPAGVGGAPARPKRGQVSVGTEHGDWFPQRNRRLRGDAEQSHNRTEHHGKGERSHRRRTSRLFLAHIYAQRHANPPIPKGPWPPPGPPSEYSGSGRTGDESDRPTSLSRLPERGVSDRGPKAPSSGNIPLAPRRRRMVSGRTCDHGHVDEHARRVVAPVFEALDRWQVGQATLEEVQAAANAAAEAIDNANAPLRDCLRDFDAEVETARFALAESQHQAVVARLRGRLLTVAEEP